MTARQYDSMTARQYDSMTARQYDSMTARQYDSMTARQYDSMTAQQYDSITEQEGNWNLDCIHCTAIVPVTQIGVGIWTVNRRTGTMKTLPSTSGILRMCAVTTGTTAFVGMVAVNIAQL